MSFFVKWPAKKERGLFMTKKVIGYLPDEKPTIAKSLLFAVQQFLVMFGNSFSSVIDEIQYSSAISLVVSLLSVFIGTKGRYTLF